MRDVLKKLQKTLSLASAFPSSSSSADITLKVGKPKPSDEINTFTKNNLRIEVDKNDRHLIYNGKHGIYPYNGVVASFRYSGVNYILVYGTEIDGTIAAVKRLIERQSNYLKPGVEDSEYLNNLNVDAIAVSDVMHSEKNQQYYMDNTDNNFKLIVNDTLFNNYQVDLKHVKTNDGTVLRLKKVKAKNSNSFLDATVRKKPVIYSGGLWNNLFKFKDFADEMASTGREGWMIEVTGGPNEECDTCPDYTYSTLKDDWWPASVAAALAYSETDGVLNANPSLDKADYVGFSNGCRVALDALKDHGSGYSNNWKREDSSGSLIVDTSLPASSIDTFVGVACPGAFEYTLFGDTLFQQCMTKYGDSILKDFKDKKHISMKEFGEKLLLRAPNDFFCSRLSVYLGDATNKNIKISSNLGEQYITWIKSTTDSQPANNLNLNRFLIIRGIAPALFSGDGVVTTKDTEKIYNNIIANRKKHYAVPDTHPQLPDDKITKDIIQAFLNNQTLSKGQFSYDNLYLKEEYP